MGFWFLCSLEGSGLGAAGFPRGEVSCGFFVRKVAELSRRVLRTSGAGKIPSGFFVGMLSRRVLRAFREGGEVSSGLFVRKVAEVSRRVLF